jgi:glycerol kinase
MADDERETKRPRVEGAESEEHLPSGITETEDELQHKWFVGSIDQGTTSSRFLIFNGVGDPVASHQIEFENLYPESGYEPFTTPFSS